MATICHRQLRIASRRTLDPDAPEPTPYQSSGPLLPRSLEEALAALRENACQKEGLGAQFVDYYCRIKEAEIARLNLEVSDWEHREYFDLY